MSTTEQVGDVDIELDLEPVVGVDEDKEVGTFTVNIDIEQTDGSKNPVLIKGDYLLEGDKRYVLFDKVEPNNTTLGNIKRRIARMSNLRFVDQSLFDKAVKEFQRSK